MSLEADIKQKGLDLGFDAVGITTAEPIEMSHVQYFRKWLAEGRAGEMGYLHRNLEKRFDPAKLLKGAKSVICVALNYRPVKNNGPEARSTLKIAHFAQHEDYHPFIKGRLFQLAEFIKTKAWSGSDTMRQPRAVRSPQDRSIPALPLPSSLFELRRTGRASVTKRIKFKACVDSVPIAERALAQRAGLGFIGRNHMLIHPELGNQILLGELITTLQLQPDEPMTNHPCGDCGRCIRACPTGALAPDGAFDARKCISYQTIEAPTGSATVPVAYKNNRGRDARTPVVIAASEPGSRTVPSGCRIKSGMTDRERDYAKENFKNYIFGCDECILACPHELGKPPRENMDFQHHPEWQNLTLDKIQNMTEDQFQKTFANSGFLRLGLEGLKHNCLHTKV